jgi:hypothetical protein
MEFYGNYLKWKIDLTQRPIPLILRFHQHFKADLRENLFPGTFLPLLSRCWTRNSSPKLMIFELKDGFSSIRKY